MCGARDDHTKVTDKTVVMQGMLLWYICCQMLTNCSFARPPHPLWRGPSSWGLDILWAIWAPSPREMFWCRTSTWWRAFFSQGKGEEEKNECMNYFSFPFTDFSRELQSVFRSELHALNVLKLLRDIQTEQWKVLESAVHWPAGKPSARYSTVHFSLLPFLHACLSGCPSRISCTKSYRV